MTFKTGTWTPRLQKVTPDCLSARSRRGRFDQTVLVFWLLSALSIPVLLLLHYSIVGWDLHVYANAIKALDRHQNPYDVGILVQRAFHVSSLAHDPNVMPPYTYVYSPITLPLLRAVGHVPALLSSSYWFVYTLGLLATIWAGVRIGSVDERPFLLLAAPVAAYFPGLLQTNVLFSGNLAFILYGVVLTSAVYGWRRGKWAPFYVATLAASCFKAPLLTLVLIPMLSARGQNMRAAAVGVLGVALFAVQTIVAPVLFRSYLEAVELQFSYNHDFGLSPSGLLGNTLFSLSLPYQNASVVTYALYAPVVLGLLIVLSRKFRAGLITLEEWTPVMLLGVVLLNPRIKEYDVAPLTLPMALVLLRAFGFRRNQRRALFRFLILFVTLNVLVSISDVLYKPVSGVLLVAAFVLGVKQLVTGPVLDHYLSVRQLALRPRWISDMSTRRYPRSRSRVDGLSGSSAAGSREPGSYRQDAGPPEVQGISATPPG